jgi:hypothetical protein
MLALYCFFLSGSTRYYLFGFTIFFFLFLVYEHFLLEVLLKNMKCKTEKITKIIKYYLLLYNLVCKIFYNNKTLRIDF